MLEYWLLEYLDVGVLVTGAFACRIVSTDKILRFINTFIIIVIDNDVWCIRQSDVRILMVDCLDPGALVISIVGRQSTGIGVLGCRVTTMKYSGDGVLVSEYLDVVVLR